MSDDRNKLDALIELPDASSTTLQRDWWRGGGRKGDWGIRGKFGHIYPDGTGYLICVVSVSTRRWNSIQHDLAFCRVTQDGDDEGCLHLDRLPAPHEAGVIREALGIKRKRQLSPEAKASLAHRLLPKPTGSPSDGPVSAGSLAA
jgi:hypothetical protein